MNTKTYELLIYLMENNNRSFKIDELAEKFNVSNRSIRNYLAIISDFFYINKIDNRILNTKDRIQYIGDEALSKHILSLSIINGFYDYKLSSNERVFIMTLLLLTTKDYLTLSDFEEILFISKVSVSKDMKKVVEFLKSCSIELMENKRQGYLLNMVLE